MDGNDDIMMNNNKNSNRMSRFKNKIGSSKIISYLSGPDPPLIVKGEVILDFKFWGCSNNI